MILKKLNRMLFAGKMASAVFMSFCLLQVTAQDTSLRNMSPFPFGAAINTTLLKNNTNYRSVVTKEYSSITAENVMKFGPIHPAQNTYNWIDADTVVNFAEKNNKRVHGHTLVWHQSLPAWVTNYAGDSAAWENLLKTHIQTVVGHYQGRVTSWDVVNEAFNDDGTLRNSIWLQHLGSNYISRCFQYAHEADPNAFLFYNDYGHEYSTAKLNAIAALVNTFKTNGTPIHGVGMQMHMSKNTNNNSIAAAIAVMVQTGLKVHISELDIAMNPENNQALTFTPALSQLQADKYKFVTRTYKSIPVTQQYGITTWNVSDADTWITGTYARPDWPLPFDASYQKKQAYQSIIEALTTVWKYDASTGKSNAGNYIDLGNNGTVITTNFAGNAMTNDDDNSSVQQIGFDFSYNGSSYQQFVLNTNGYIKLGANAPSFAAIFYATFNANTNSIVNAADVDVLYPYNHDLMGTGTTEYRTYTSGQPGSRVCTIQYKNVADKLPPVQYANMQFQVKLYESGGIVEFVYAPWTASASMPTLITAAVGIKGTSAANSVNLAKGSGTNWSTALSTANTIYYVNGDYASAGPQFNSRNNVLPDAGRTLRFLPLSEAILPITLSDFFAVNEKTNVTLSWITANELNSKNYEIQRSVNAVDFVSIGNMVSKEKENNLQHKYSFTDANISGLSGTVYYRLKQNDYDGNSTYSRVLMIQLGTFDKVFDVKTRNPFKNIISLQVTSRIAGKVSISLTNSGGVVMMKKEMLVRAGSSSLNIDETTALPRGVYVLQCRLGDEVKSLRLLKE